MSEYGRTVHRQADAMRTIPPRAIHRASRTLLTRGRILTGLACLLGGAIIVNAVMLQNEKHPAPLFRTIARVPDTSPVPPMRPGAGAMERSAAFTPTSLTATKPASLDRSKASAPVVTASPDSSEALLAEIQRELGKRGYYKGDTDGKPGPMTTQAIREFQFSQRVAVDGKPSEALLHDVLAAKVTMKDELLDLVKRTSQDDKTTRTIADVQRALNKAGYGPLTEDGQMGPSTKQALARFEADRKLPPRGEPKGPVLKVLASVSGISISQ